MEEEVPTAPSSHKPKSHTSPSPVPATPGKSPAPAPAPDKPAPASPLAVVGAAIALGGAPLAWLAIRRWGRARLPV